MQPTPGDGSPEPVEPAAHQHRANTVEDLKLNILNLAAHELRGPIAVIRGYLSMLEDASLDAAGLRRVLPILTTKAAQMDVLVTRMLQAARLGEGRLRLRLERIDLGAVVREAVDVAGLLAPPGITMLFERLPGPIEVVADRGAVATIAANLLDNAVKYSPAGGLVSVIVAEEEGRGVVRVKDSGLGIAADDLPRLFTHFGRVLTPENSHIGGTGLGLHLSRELARAQFGDVEVASEPGLGSTFTLWLPLAAPRS